MTDVTTAPADTRRPKQTPGKAMLAAQRRFPLAQVAVLIVLFIYGASSLPGFGSESSVKTMLVLAALLGLASLGQTLVMIVGGLDLSIPGFIVFGSIGVSELYGTHGWPTGPAILIVVVVAAALGAMSGYICHRYRILPLIVTLGVGSIAAGLVVAWTKSQVSGEAPPVLTDLTSVTGTTFGFAIPSILVIWAAIIIVVAVILHRSVWGRRFYATGANPRAAALARIPTGRVWTATFAFSAAVASLVGVLLAGFSGADQSLGDPYFFQGLAAVIVGGTTIMGARGDYTHTAVGALILTVLTTILVGKGYDSADNQIIFGVLILLVVAGYGRDRRLRDTV